MPQFEDFFADEYEPVVRSLTLVFGDRDVAEDAAQTAFEKALRRWSRVGQMERPGTWVYVVAVRSGRRSLGRRSRHPESPAAGAVPSPESTAVDAAWVREALDRLAPRQRAVVVLRHHGGLPLSDIASSLGISVGTVKSTLHTAYRRLNVDLADQHNDEEVTRDATRPT